MHTKPSPWFHIPRGGLAIGDTGEIPGGPTGFGPVQYIHVSLKFRLNSLKAEYVHGGGAWRRRLVIHPDNFTVSSVILKICAQGEGGGRGKIEFKRHYSGNFMAT